MNKSKIEWCDHTWNPITGCRHGCKYCYANHMVKRFAGDTRLNIMAKKDYRMEASHDGSEDVYVLDEPMLNETGKPLVYPFGFEPTFHRHRLNTLDKLKMGNNVFVGAMPDMKEYAAMETAGTGQISDAWMIRVRDGRDRN